MSQQSLFAEVWGGAFNDARYGPGESVSFQGRTYTIRGVSKGSDGRYLYKLSKGLEVLGYEEELEWMG